MRRLPRVRRPRHAMTPCAAPSRSTRCLLPASTRRAGQVPRPRPLAVPSPPREPPLARSAWVPALGALAAVAGHPAITPARTPRSPLPAAPGWLAPALSSIDMRRGALAVALALALLLGACSAQPGGDGGIGLAAPEELVVAPSPELAPAPAPAPEDFSITAARSPPSKRPGLAALAGAAGGAATNTTAVQPSIALAAPVGDGGVTGTNATNPVAAAASSQQPTIAANASPSPAVDPAAAVLGNATQPAVAAADVGASPPASLPSPIGEHGVLLGVPCDDVLLSQLV